MKLRKTALQLLAVTALTCFLAGIVCGCARRQPAAPKKEEAKEAEAKPEAPRIGKISIGTGGTGGTYYPYGGAMAKIFNEKVPGCQATAEVTAASVENVRLVVAGQADMGLIMNDVAHQAITGTGPFKEKQDIRTLFAMYPNVFHAVTLAEYPIKTFSDLKGKRVSVGAPGSGTETQTKLTLDALGMKFDDFTVHRLSFAENTSALRDKIIDVGCWSVGPPTSSIMDLATTHKIRIISMTDEEQKKVAEKYPFYVPYTLRAGTYQGQDENVRTTAVWNSVIVSAKMPEDVAYTLVKAVFDNVQMLIDVYKGAKDTTPENTIESAVAPLHPGAVKYLKEKGLKVPEKILPKG